MSNIPVKDDTKMSAKDRYKKEWEQLIKENPEFNLDLKKFPSERWGMN